MKIEEANKYNIDDLEDFACDFDHGTMFVESVNYDSLEQKLAEAKEKLEVALLERELAESRIAIMARALEWYACRTSWTGKAVSETDYIPCIPDSRYKCGGRTARQALEKLKELK